MDFPYPAERTACYLWLQVIEQSSTIQAADEDNASCWVRTKAVGLRMIGAVGLAVACAIDLSIWALQTVTIFRICTRGLSLHFMHLVKTIVCIAYVILLPFHLVRRPLHIADSALIAAPPSEQRSHMRKLALDKIMQATPARRQAWIAEVTAKLRREALESGPPFDYLIRELIANRWCSFAAKILENPTDFGMAVTDLGAVEEVYRQIFDTYGGQELTGEEASDVNCMMLARINNDNIPFEFDLKRSGDDREPVGSDEEATFVCASDFCESAGIPVHLIHRLLEKATRLERRIPKGQYRAVLCRSSDKQLSSKDRKNLITHLINHALITHPNSY